MDSGWNRWHLCCIQKHIQTDWQNSWPPPAKGFFRIKGRSSTSSRRGEESFWGYGMWLLVLFYQVLATGIHWRQSFCMCPYGRHFSSLNSKPLVPCPSLSCMNINTEDKYHRLNWHDMIRDNTMRQKKSFSIYSEYNIFKLQVFIDFG